MVNKKKIFGDVTLNIIATVIPLVALQVIILPLLARKMDSDLYGFMLTIISLLTIVSFSAGNALNNVRLLMRLQYEEEKLVGDFNILLLIVTIATSIIVGIGTIFFSSEISVLLILLVVVASALMVFREYFSVAFRLQLNFKSIFFNNIFLTLGYFIGLFIYIYSKAWAAVYLAGYLLSLLYIIKKSNLFREPLRKTKYFNLSKNKLIKIIIASILSSSITYIDRLLLYPIIGGTSVSIYYTATLVGKLLGTFISPITSVVLSYISRISKLNSKQHKSVIILSIGFGVLGYIICLLASKPILTILYPQWVDSAMAYIYVTTGIAIMSTLTSMINPFILKFANTNWQIVSSTINLVVYLFASLLLFSIYGLMGFAVGALIANFVRFIIVVIVFFRVNTIEVS